MGSPPYVHAGNGPQDETRTAVMHQLDRQRSDADAAVAGRHFSLPLCVRRDPSVMTR